ncbi:hypothetical protein KUW00_16575 [Halomonas sp. DP5N14-9]|uniref:MMPL family transporter n=1 Tax=Halomonas sp. DP5N14-9 TaxID=2859075 RepID=UPI001C99601D|nr:hypothetical protein [Halomonas sp. DP5N14-9]MBY5942497.1 hypothetical protein [Halomonas sp. DP5N14-9]
MSLGGTDSGRGALLASRGWGLVLLACIVLLAVQVLRGAPLDTRITALLPEHQQGELIARADDSLASTFERRFLLLVASDATPHAAPVEAVNELRQALTASGIIASLDSQSPPRPDQTLTPYRYRLLTDSLARQDAEAWRQRGLSRLFAPGVDADLERDPFGLLDGWLEARFQGPVSWHPGGPGVVTDKTEWSLIGATLAASPYDMALQQELSAVLERFGQAHPELTLLRAGLVFHAAAGARQASHEIATIGLGSLFGILALLALVFRRPLVIATLLLPVATGLVFASALTWLIFGSLNLITLAFGASLIGLSVDYALHLQCTRQLNPGRSLRLFWPGLALGLASSLCAYLVQLATPLPGLRQMATFTALGLIGAWLSVRLWLPRLPLYHHPATATIARRLDRLRVGRGQRWVYLALALVLVVAAVLALTRSTTSHDLRQLNPSPAALIAEQQRVQTLLERPASFRYLIVSAETPDALLKRLEQLDEPLSRLEREGHLSSHRHLAQAVPSMQTQEHNLERVRERYAAALPELLTAAGLPSTLIPRLEDPLHEVPFLSPQTWLSSRAGEADRALWLDGLERPAALITIGEVDATASKALTQLAESPDVIYRDRVAALSQQLALLSEELVRWLALALALLVVVFGLRYRRHAWRVLLPPVGAVIITLGLYALSHTGLTLFHLLGLLLVLGIGLDAGIFSTEHPQDPGAWLAISLSCASSLLAFGLLAFSATPALHFLGQTCLIGLVATWCLVPLARGATERAGVAAHRGVAGSDTQELESSSHGRST